MIEKISSIGFEKTVGLIMSGQAGVVLCCTMNEIMMADSDVVVRKAMNRADILTPDGMPLVWYLRWKLGKGDRVYGPDIMRKILTFKSQILKKMLFIGDVKNRSYFEKYGKYVVLPYKDNFGENDYQQLAIEVKRLKVSIVWVGLGAKKQILMADGLRRCGVKVPIVTVGAALDFLSGNKKQAPRWMREVGLEWVYRLSCEPKRLAGRYLVIIEFVVGKLLGRLWESGEYK